MDIKEQIAVMQAFADGKEIECYNKSNDEGWFITLNPIWNWAYYDYRIKPEPKLRPYTFEELQAEMAKGKIVVKRKNESCRQTFTITQILDDCDEKEKIQLSDWLKVSYEYFSNNFQWLDESPCGVIEE